MVTVVVGQSEHVVEPGWQSWAQGQLREHDRAGTTPCVKVRVEGPSLSLTFAGDGCRASRGGGGRRSPAEQSLIDEWGSAGVGEVPVSFPASSVRAGRGVVRLIGRLTVGQTLIRPSLVSRMVRA